MNIFKMLKEKISFKSSEKKLKPDFYSIELSNRNISIEDDYEEIQAFVYRDLDLLKKNKIYSTMKNNVQPLSEEAKNKILENKKALARSLDKMIKEAASKKPSPDESPIPRHPSTPDSE
jgi:hypothetical protein